VDQSQWFGQDPSRKAQPVIPQPGESGVIPTSAPSEWFGADVPDPLDASLRAAQTTTPDAAARVLRLQERTGLAPAVIQRNPDAVEAQATAAEFDAATFRRDNPRLAAWLQDPTHAALAHDDLHPLGFLESVLRGVDVAQSLTYGAVEATGELVGAAALTAYGRRGRVENEAAIAAAGPRTSVFDIQGPGAFVQWAKETIGEQIPIMTPIVGAAAAGAAIGSVVPGVGTAIGALVGAAVPSFVMGVGEVQSGIKAIDPEASAPGWAFAGGSAIAALDSVLPGKIGSRLVTVFGREAAEAVAMRALAAPAKAAFITAAGKGFATEGLTEAIQEAVGAVAVSQGSGAPVSGDLWRQMIEAGASGALVGGVMGGGEASAESWARVRRARQNPEFFNALATGVTDSKTVTRMPAAAQEFLMSVSNEHVYAPIASWTSYWTEHGMNPAVMAARLTGNPDAYATAQRTGADLAIPVAAYAVQLAGTEHNAFFATELRRLQPDELNAREATTAPPIVTAFDDPLRRAATVEQLTAAGAPVETANQIAALGEEALADAVADRGPTLFATADAAGMTTEQFGDYHSLIVDAERVARESLDRAIVEDLQREQSPEAQAARAAVRETVAVEVHQEPVYRVLAAMRDGTKPDGSPLVEGVESAIPLTLSRGAIVEQFGEERAAALPPEILADDGLHPDVVAELFGFSSADELVTRVAAAPTMAAAIEKETTDRLDATQGSMRKLGTRRASAQAAVAHERRDEVLRFELQALTDLKALRRQIRGGAVTIRTALPSAAAVREEARARLAALPVRAIEPALYWSASRQAAQKAIEAAGRQDFDAAIAAKTQELHAAASYREARRVVADVAKRVTRVQSLRSGEARGRLGLAGASYLAQVDGLLDQYQFAAVSARELERRVSLRAWVIELEKDGMPVDLPEAMIDDARRIHYSELTVEEFLEVTDGLQQIVHLARLKNRLLKRQDARELAAVATELATSIREHAPGPRREGARDRRPSEERRRMVEDWFAGHRKLASTLRELDGFADGGPAWEAIMRPLNEAANTEAVMNADATQRFGALVEAAYPKAEKRKLYTKIHIPAINKSLSRMERVMVALNWGNEGNRQRLRDAEHWTDAQVAAVLATLDHRDLTFVQGVFDFIESYWAEIAAKQTRVTGVAPAKVEAVPIVTRVGTFAGGYFPLKYDDRLSASAIAHLDLDAANLAKQAAYAHATTARGHTMARAASVRMPVRLDFGVMFEHVQQVIHDLSHHEALIDVTRVLGHPVVQQAILETHGDQTYKQMRGTIRDVAFGAVPAVNGFERGLNHLRVGATIAGLGWNVTTAFLQPLGLSNSMQRIGVRWVGRGLTRWLRSPTTMGETVEWITERSAMMRLRGQTQQREINEIRQQIGVDTGRLTGWVDEALSRATFNQASRQGIADSYFWMIQQMQRVADVPTWLGQYEKSMEAGESEERAIALADQAVLDSQGGGQIKDLCQLQRGGPMLKLWTNFYSFFNVVHNQLTESHRRFRGRPYSAAGAGRLASDYLLLVTVPVTLGYVLRAALRPGDADDDDAIAWTLAMEHAAYLSGTMLGLREIGGTLQGYYGYQGPAGARFFGSLGKLYQQVEQGEFDAAAWKALNETAGILFHYPAGQVKRTLDGISALSEGRTENPLALVTGAPK